MKKSVKVAGIVLGGAILLGMGTAVGVGASGLDWKTEAINSAYNDLLATANNTVNDLTKDVNSDVNNKVQSEINGTVEDQQAELNRLLDEYYNMKLEGMTSDNPEFKAVEQQIVEIKANVLDAYKKRIDEAFQGNK